MRKLKVLLKAPVLVNAGYGVHSQMIYKALKENPNFDLFVESISWGTCSFSLEDSEFYRELRGRVEFTQQALSQGLSDFDLFIHVTVPNEFERKGRVNVGITAGIETDKVSPQWLQKCNEMDLIIVPSEHSKKSFQDTVVDWNNEKTGETGVLTLTTPIQVVHEGVESEMFESEFKNLIGLEIQEEFAFLHVGQWGGGNLGEDRKNIGLMIQSFIDEFLDRKDVALVLKTNMSKNSQFDFDMVKSRIDAIKKSFNLPEERLPKIYLIHANLTREEIVDLYKHPKIKAYISMTHGEGFSIPTLEATMAGLPVLTTNWSGHLDFLSDKFIPLEYELKPIPDSVVWEPLLIKGSRWAEVNVDDTKKKMRKIVNKYSQPKQWAQELQIRNKVLFDLESVNETFTDTLNTLIRGNLRKLDIEEYLKSFVDTQNDYNIVYTMPMSTGDVFISTAVIDGLMKEVPEGSKLYFATDPKYFDLLKGNPHVYKCIPWFNEMLHVDLLEEIFDLALTPNVSTQLSLSNWVRRGQGRLLAEEFANHCHTQLGEYFIEKDESVLHADARLCNVTEKSSSYVPYMTLHVGSGKGQWEGRNYRDWKEVLKNIKDLAPELKVVQVGGADEPTFTEVDVDLRGKTNYQQLAGVQLRAMLHLGIDSFNMHLAVALGVPTVAIFGCSTPTATGPWVKDKTKAKFILLASERKSGCSSKPCYKNRCSKAKEADGPISEIDPLEIFKACARLLVQANNE